VKSVQLLFKCIIEFGSGTTQFGAMAGIVLAWLETAADCDAPALAAILIRRQGALLHCGSLRQNVSVFTNLAQILIVPV
jgi:hypothetical protein